VKPSFRGCPRRPGPRTGASYPVVVTTAPYRVLHPQPPDPYLAAWASLRRLRRIMVGVAAWVVCIAAATCVFAVWTNHCLAKIVAIGIILSAAAVFRLAFSGPAFFTCPRCRRGFFAPNATLFGLTTENCSHCGIAVGTPAQRRSEP
jgi:hypothetical protein